MTRRGSWGEMMLRGYWVQWESAALRRAPGCGRVLSKGGTGEGGGGVQISFGPQPPRLQGVRKGGSKIAFGVLGHL